MLICARHYRSGELIDIACDGGVIASVRPSAAMDDSAPWIAPGFCDVQINGALGHAFGDPALSHDAMHAIVRECRRHGVTQLCPTFITAAHDELAAALQNVSRACADDAELAAAVVGFHLEGPFLSPLDGPRGAHPIEHIRSPDWDEFRRLQDAADGRIRLTTLAPERPGALDLIRRLAGAGIVVAVGHTAATPAEIRAAIAAGARMSTHLGNGSHAVLPRHDNYLWEQLAADELWASVIVDGHHLPPAVVKSIVRAKSLKRLVLTCDAGPLAGMPPGRYRQWGQDLDVRPEGKIVVAGTPFLAGSWAFTDTCVRTIVEFAGLSVADAVDLAAVQPRRILGLPERTIEVGQLADFVLFDAGPFVVRETPASRK
jgi:N-acetylglucosamine-6-phosphate deacetylase